MFHPSYFEPKAQMFRAEERRHLARMCDWCGEEQVCPDAVMLDDDYKECRFAGCQGGTCLQERSDPHPLRNLVCGMCY